MTRSTDVDITAIPVKFTFEDPSELASIEQERDDGLELYQARLGLQHLSLVSGYDELLCLDQLSIDRYWYQIETVKKVLKYFRGRVLLADEVGLGKTIEAGMLMKEYLLRGLVRRVLILTPPSLVSQWREEMLSKFSVSCVTTDDVDVKRHPEFWTSNERIIASIHTAKSAANFELVTKVEWDLVIVDEAHHLKNRATLNWKLVNSLTKRFIFLLTATPVQNNLVELYNLLTLIMPGVLKTEAQFRREYVAQNNPTMPKNHEKLRELLREVMVRNTRSVVDVKLPRRFASTIVIRPSPEEERLYEGITALVRAHYHEQKGLDQMLLNSLLMKAGSSPHAAADSLVNVARRFGWESIPSGLDDLTDLIALAQSIESTEKAKRMVELLRQSQGKVMIFTHYMKTFASLAEQLQQAGVRFVEFHGGMTSAAKDESIQRFRDEADVLLSTESGGEGRNIQFCQTMVNYDLPWNPMRLEQRIGRIHRIGQTKDVFVFNFCIKGSIEEYILHILHNKINMFELVVGEIDSILGNLETDEEFSDVVLNLWLRAGTKEERDKEFETLGDELVRAKATYLGTKKLDEALFSEDFEA